MIRIQYWRFKICVSYSFYCYIRGFPSPPNIRKASVYEPWKKIEKEGKRVYPPSIKLLYYTGRILDWNRKNVIGRVAVIGQTRHRRRGEKGTRFLQRFAGRQTNVSWSSQRSSYDNT